MESEAGERTSARCTATFDATSPTTTSGGLIYRSTRMLPSRGLPNRQPAARSCQFHTSAVCITTTNGEPPDRRSRRRFNLAVLARRPVLCIHTAARSSTAMRISRLGFSSVGATLIARYRRLLTVRTEFLIGTGCAPPASQVLRLYVINAAGALRKRSTQLSRKPGASGRQPDCV